MIAQSIAPGEPGSRGLHWLQVLGGQGLGSGCLGRWLRSFAPPSAFHRAGGWTRVEAGGRSHLSLRVQAAELSNRATGACSDCASLQRPRVGRGVLSARLSSPRRATSLSFRHFLPVLGPDSSRLLRHLMNHGEDLTGEPPFGRAPRDSELSGRSHSALKICVLSSADFSYCCLGEGLSLLF